MKLTIAHLAPYLPYGIKGYFLGRLDIVTGFDNDFKIISSLNHGNCLITDFKPILRNLSDLTKEIEHNGEKLVPFHYIYELVAEYASRHPKRKILDNAANGWDICNRLNPNTLSYTSFKMLLEWHFDVFGLIDKGLAIDINTLKPLKLIFTIFQVLFSAGAVICIVLFIESWYNYNINVLWLAYFSGFAIAGWICKKLKNNQ